MRTIAKAIVSGGLLAGVTMGAVGASDAAISSGHRSYAQGKYELQINGVNVGFLTSIAGGSPYADVVTEKLGADKITKKHIGNVKYEAISAECGTGMSKDFYQWLADMIGHSSLTRKTGAIEVLDSNSKESSKLQFANAALAEVGFPALDAASKEAAKLTFTFAPEWTKRLAGSQASVASHEATASQKHWSSANFRVTIPGLETRYIAKVDPLVFKQKLVQDAVGELRDYQSEPGVFEVPNIAVTLDESKADTWYKWLDDFVVKGNSGDANEKTATIEFLSDNLQTPYFTLTFRHVGIFKLTPDKVEAGSETIRRVKAEMYAEDASFSFNSAAAF